MTDNFQLYRALPRLSGNMQIDLVVDLLPGKANIREVHMRPIHNSLYVPPRDEQLLLRPHKDNIARFYTETLSSFYDSEPPANLASDWFLPVVEPPIQAWDDSLWRGCRRMCHKLYGTQCEFFVPLWLESTSGDLALELEMDKDKYLLDLTSPGSEFGRYFKEYLAHTKIATGGNSKVLNIDLTSGNTTLRGIDVTSGNFVTTIDKALVKNIMIRERPLLEFNALITNLFSEYRMICPQAINLNICFNPPKGYTGSVKVQVLSSGATLECRDLFVEHHTNVWHPGAQERYAELSADDKNTYTDARNKTLNGDKPMDTIIFNYLQDKYAVPLMHINKVTPSICHWKYADQAKPVLFNVYPYNLNASTTDSANDLTSGKVTLTSSDQEKSLFNNTTGWRDITEIMGTTKYTYTSAGGNAPNSIKILLAETSKDGHAYIPDPKNSLGIILANYGSGSQNTLPGTQANATTAPYWSYDLHRYSDIDNRYDLRATTRTYLGELNKQGITTEATFYAYTDNRKLGFVPIEYHKRPAEDGWTWVGGPGECDPDNRKAKPNIRLYPDVLYLIFNKSASNDLKVIIYYVPISMKDVKNRLILAKKREEENRDNLANEVLSQDGLTQEQQDEYDEKISDAQKRIDAIDRQIASLPTDLKISGFPSTMEILEAIRKYMTKYIPILKVANEVRYDTKYWADRAYKAYATGTPDATGDFINNVQQQIDEYHAELNRCNSSLVQCELSLEQSKRTKDAQEKRLPGLTKACNELKYKLYQKIGEISKEDKHIDTLNARIKLLNLWLAQGSGDKDKLEKDLAKAESDLAEANIRRATLLNEKIIIEKDYEKSCRDREECVNMLNNAIKDMENLPKEIDRLTKLIKELQNKITKLENLREQIHKDCEFYRLKTTQEQKDYFREHTRFRIHTISTPTGIGLADYEALYSMASTPDQKKPISYIKSIIAVRDEALPDAAEVIYRKVNIPLTTRLVYDGWIKPCFCPKGTNALYYKVPAPKGSERGKKYLASGVPPMYPSIGYDSVVRDDVGENRKLPRPWDPQACTYLRTTVDGGQITRKKNDKGTLTEDRDKLYDWHYDFDGIEGDPDNIEYIYKVTGTLK